MDEQPMLVFEDDPNGATSLSPGIVRKMTDEEYKKHIQKKKARRLQKETGMKYTKALRQVQAEEENN